MLFLSEENDFHIVLLKLAQLLEKPDKTRKDLQSIDQLLQISDFMLRDEIIDDVRLLNKITEFKRRPILLN